MSVKGSTNTIGSRIISWVGSRLAASIIVAMGSVSGLALGAVIGVVNPLVAALLCGSATMMLLVMLRQDEIALALVIAVHLYIDWYWGTLLVAQVIELALLIVYYVARSERFPWVMPPAILLWLVFLLLAIVPSMHGVSLIDTMNYYLNIFFGSFTIYWLGNLIARDVVNVRRIFQLLALIGTLIALHTIIETVTGVFLFATTRFDAYFATIGNYDLGSSGVQRAGSFLINPDSNGGFFGMMMFLSLGLFVESKSLQSKIFYLVQVFLQIVALLLTYSTGGWLAASVALIAFLIFVGYTRYRIIILALIPMVIACLLLLFPAQIGLQIQHALTPNEVTLRAGAWQTGLRVIQAYPWFGIGVGRYVYIERAEPYRVPAQYTPLAHPHNSYIEIGALGGIPLAMLFIVLLVFAFWLSLRNWRRADLRTRSLLGGGMALIVALSTDSLVVNQWTLIPVSAIGWLVLGVLSSPLLARRLVENKRDQPAAESQESSPIVGERIYVNDR